MQRNSTLDSIKSKTDHIQGTFFSKTGNGKSSTGTTLFWSLGSNERFEFRRSAMAVTSDSKTKTITCSNGLRVSLTDHPGLFDNRGRETEVSNLRNMALENSRNQGYNFICLVFNIMGRFDSIEQVGIEILGEFYQQFGAHIIVVLTHGDHINTVEEELRLTREWKQQLRNCLGFEPRYLTIITNEDDRRTPSGKDRRQSANEILGFIEDIVIRTNARRFQAKKVDEKTIKRMVEDKANKRNLSKDDKAKIFAAVITVLTVLAKVGSCSIL